MLALLKISTNDRRAFSYDEAFAPDYSEKNQQIVYLYIKISIILCTFCSISVVIIVTIVDRYVGILV